MDRQLPSLHLLHIFEAAARRQSFKLAAEDLHITPSAVSHQIKTLEAQLGMALFRRGNRRLELTEAGHAYRAVVAGAFDRLRQGTHSLRRDFGARSLRISMTPAIARQIVIPRLNGFEQRLPGVRLHIDTSEQVQDLRSDNIDLAVRYGTGDWPGVVSEKLLDLVCTPVCSPAFLREHPIQSLSDLGHLRLIQIAFFPQAWPLWSREVGLAGLDVRKELWFDTYDASIQAAEQGLGLALALLPLEQPLIDTGRLLTPFAQTVAMPQKLYLVYRPGEADRNEIRVLRDWLSDLFRSLASQSQISGEEHSLEAGQ